MCRQQYFKDSHVFNKRLVYSILIFLHYFVHYYYLNQTESPYSFFKNEKHILLFQHDVPAFICKLQTTG